ncbi:hypothetical protein [Brevibacillus sp. 179-C9.3 HS]|uniref:hypothetical protein n=1 Tax=unclassified Brevibacillus TaxID=2684853 RepID=UPI0039A3A72B
MNHQITLFHNEEICEQCRMTKEYFTTDCSKGRLIPRVAEQVKIGKIDFVNLQGWIIKE